MGLVHNYPTSHNYPLIMSFSVEENAVFRHKFSKKSPYRGRGDTPLPHPPPLARSARSGSVASLPRILPPPLRWNPGYATGWKVHRMPYRMTIRINLSAETVHCIIVSLYELFCWASYISNGCYIQFNQQLTTPIHFLSMINDTFLIHGVVTRVAENETSCNFDECWAKSFKLTSIVGIAFLQIRMTEVHNRKQV